MLRAEERVLKGEEWSSEKEAAWSKDFFFIQVLCRVDVQAALRAFSKYAFLGG